MLKVPSKDRSKQMAIQYPIADVTRSGFAWIPDMSECTEPSISPDTQSLWADGMPIENKPDCVATSVHFGWKEEGPGPEPTKACQVALRHASSSCSVLP